MSSPNKPADAPALPAANFIKNIVEADLAAGKHAQRRWAGRPGTAADHAADIRATEKPVFVMRDGKVHKAR